MLKKLSIFMKKGIAAVLALALLSALLPVRVFATEAEVSYVIDQGNVLTEEEKQSINETLYHNNNESTEIVAIFLTEAAMPAAEQLMQMAMELSEKIGYGSYAGEDSGSLFLYVNKAPSGEITMKIVPTGHTAYRFTSYKTEFMEQALGSTYQEHLDFKQLIYRLIVLAWRYHFLVINEVLNGDIVEEEEIYKATAEIEAWRERYGQNIVFLLNDNISEDRYIHFMENYFISQGYGVGEEQSGVFVIVSPHLKMFDIQFYGTAAGPHEEAEINDLYAKVAEALTDDYNILEAVYAIENFLDPTAPIPLAGEEYRIYYTMDQLEELPLERQKRLEMLSDYFSINYAFDFFTMITDTAGADADDMPEIAEQLFYDYYLPRETGYNSAGAVGLLTLFDPIEDNYAVYMTDEMKKFWEKNSSVLDAAEKYLARKLEGEYSAEAMFEYQNGIFEILKYLKNKESKYSNVIDEINLFENLDMADRLAKLEKQGLNVLLISILTSGFDSAEMWLEEYRQLMQAAGLAENMVVLLYVSDTNEWEVAYFGNNKEIANTVGGEIYTKLDNFFNENDIMGFQDKFLEQLENRLVPILAAQSSKGEKQEEAAAATQEQEKAEAAVTKASGSNTMIIIIVAVVVVVILLIVILLVAGRKKKKGAAGTLPYGNSQGDSQVMGAYPQGVQGYGDSAQSSANTGYPQRTQPINEGYSGFVQNGMNVSYSQGAQPISGGYGDFAQSRANTGYPQGMQPISGGGYGNYAQSGANTGYPQGAHPISGGYGGSVQPAYPTDGNIGYSQPASGFEANPQNDGQMRQNGYQGYGYDSNYEGMQGQDPNAEQGLDQADASGSGDAK